MNIKRFIALFIVSVLVNAYFSFTRSASNTARDRLDAAIAKSGGKFIYKDIFYNILTQNIIISHVSIQPPGAESFINIDEIVVRRIDLKNSIPHFLYCDIKGLKLDPTTFGNTGAATFASLGYTGPLSCDISTNYNFTFDKSQFTLQSLYTAKDVGSLRMDVSFGNIDFDAKQLPQTLALASNITLLQAEIAYVDASLLARLLKLEAAEKGVDVPTLKTTLAGQAEAFLEQKQLPHTTSVVTALKQFIENPRQLTISLTPAMPVPLGEIGRAGSPEAVDRLLSLEVKS